MPPRSRDLCLTPGILGRDAACDLGRSAATALLLGQEALGSSTWWKKALYPSHM
jgi:hypothetical protein